ncbi:MAG: hypothetical protein MJZ22_04725 [Candidatus Saccharibacteria bacterium]|nr:hypothetical protein [Candidatus Saccharibacteria bacterium]
MKTNTKTILFFLFASLLLILPSCNKLTPKKAAQAFLDQDRREHAYTLQQFHEMSSEIIEYSIDSVDIVNTAEPYRGYVHYTFTVKYNTEYQEGFIDKISLVVPIKDITRADNGEIVWKHHTFFIPMSVEQEMRNRRFNKY